MTELALALAAIWMGWISPPDVVVQESEQVAVVAPPEAVAVEPAPTPPSHILPDVEPSEGRLDPGGWPSPIYVCGDGGTTDAAQMASITGLPLVEVTAALEQNCTRL